MWREREIIREGFLWERERKVVDERGDGNGLAWRQRKEKDWWRRRE